MDTKQSVVGFICIWHAAVIVKIVTTLTYLLTQSAVVQVLWLYHVCCCSYHFIQCLDILYWALELAYICAILAYSIYG